MLATRLPGILPNLSTEEALETAAIQSVTQGEFDVNNCAALTTRHLPWHWLAGAIKNYSCVD